MFNIKEDIPYYLVQCFQNNIKIAVNRNKHKVYRYCILARVYKLKLISFCIGGDRVDPCEGGKGEKDLMLVS